MATELLDAPQTELAKAQPINWTLLRQQAIQSFEIQSAEIAKEVESDTAITVSDANTRKAANVRRLIWVKRRTNLERTRKAAAADARAIVDLVKEVADTFQAEFSQAEDHLTGQIEQWDAAIEKAEQEQRDAVFDAKNTKLQAAGIVLDRILVDSLTDEQIDERIADANELYRLRKAEADRLAAEKIEADRIAAANAEAVRIEAEKLASERAAFEAQQAEHRAAMEAQKKIDDERFAAERAELDRQRAEMAEEKRKIDEEAARAAKVEADRLAEIERQRVAAEMREAMRLAAEVQVDRDIAEAKAAQKRADEEAARREALKPDREKLRIFCASVASLEVPAVDLLLVRSLLVEKLNQTAKELWLICDEKLR